MKGQLCTVCGKQVLGAKKVVATSEGWYHGECYAQKLPTCHPVLWQQCLQCGANVDVGLGPQKCVCGTVVFP